MLSSSTSPLPICCDLLPENLLDENEQSESSEGGLPRPEEERGEDKEAATVAAAAEGAALDSSDDVPPGGIAKVGWVWSKLWIPVSAR